MAAHALLGASSSSRWINCPPSARLNEVKADTASEYAAEGTEAHELCEFLLRKHLKQHKKTLSKFTSDLKYYNREMQDSADSYVEYIAEIIGKDKATVLVEQKLDYSRYVPEGFGTGDCIIIKEDKLYIIDFKYGKGIPVSADNNPQMKLYAVGALESVDFLFEGIKNVTMVIYQPRLSNLSTYDMTVEDLYKWAETELKTQAALAWEGKGEFKCGAWCTFCKCKATCRARYENNMELAKYDFEPGALLEDYEVEAILDKADEFIAWAKAIQDYALDEAVKGKKWERYKIVEGRSNRKYKDEDQVASIVQAEGLDPYARKVLGITDMTKLLGKKRFDELLTDLITKPEGKPVLVPRDDKREELNTNPAEDFDDDFGVVD